MSNMSYCRFENTAHDLDDCKDALKELVIGEMDHDGEPQPLSKRELQAAKKLVSLCQAIISMMADAAYIKEDEALEEDFDDTLDEINLTAARHAREAMEPAREAEEEEKKEN